MKTTAAILWEAPGAWDVRTVDLDEPGEGEVLVKVMASGLCHSDDHFAKGDMRFHSYPACGGHEGAGIVEAVGPGVTRDPMGEHEGGSPPVPSAPAVGDLERAPSGEHGAEFGGEPVPCASTTG
ncbi:alcohol dehydrogenase catalytic domain-containing protein [Gordonia aichiensis]